MFESCKFKIKGKCAFSGSGYCGVVLESISKLKKCPKKNKKVRRSDENNNKSALNVSPNSHV